MRLEHEGIHKRVGFLIQHCGRYDREYHIVSLSKKLNIDVQKVRELFNESLLDNRLKYIKLLEDGNNIDDVIKLVKVDTEKVENYFIKVTAKMNEFPRSPMLRQFDVRRMF